MSTEYPDDGERVEQEFRIIELKGQAQELAGGEMESWVDPECPPEVARQFWEQVVAFESAEQTTHYDRLLGDGMVIPSPDELDDALLSAKLWEIIYALAQQRVFLSSTDHLSDRELYNYLWSDGLREWTPEFPPEMEMNCHIDLASSGSDEDIEIWLRYYADADAREHWREEWPNYPMPPEEDPPYDRDQHLPQAEYDGENGEDDETPIDPRVN